MTSVILVVLAVPFVTVLVARPLLRRLATRSAVRRPVEAMLVISGSLLGTAIITGSLIVGDTIDRSIRAAAYDQLGPVDEVVSVPIAQGDALRARFAGFSSRAVDGVLPMTTTGAAVLNPGRAGGSQPTAQLVEVDFRSARRFGGDANATGIAGPTPAPGSAAITSDLARKLRIDRGDRIVVFAAGASETVRVDRVLPRRGVAGFWTADRRQQSYNVFVAPGTTARLAASGGRGTVGEPPQALVAISNTGGVEAGSSRTDQAISAIDARLEGMQARARPLKRDLLERADATGKSLTQLYFTVGMFAVAAGILLLVNVFVMLADERRAELGMLRAMGLRRSSLVGSLATEGWFYAMLASALGAVLGIGFGWVIAWRADRILGSGRETEALRLTFTFHPSTIVTGFALGLAISVVTIVVSSIRIARFNIIQAIRDIDATPRARPRRRWARIGDVVALLGIALTIVGVTGPDAYSVMAGPMLVVLGLAPTAARRFPSRLVGDVVCLLVLAWGIGSFVVLRVIDATIEIPLFLLQGLTMTAAAVYLVTAHLRGVGELLERRGGSALEARLGVAYPLARRTRTAMTLGMFAIIVLTLVYMSEISFMFNNRADAISKNLSGGFGVELLSNPSAPVRAADLAALPGVRRVAPLGYTMAEFTTATRKRTAWPVSGIGPELVAAPPTLRDRGAFTSDVAAWRAVVDDPNLAIVDDFFLQSGGGPSGKAAKIGDRIVMYDPVTNRSRTLRVVAVAEGDYLGSGAFVGQRALSDVFHERAVPSRFFVGADDPDATVRRIRSTFVANGADAETVRSVVDTALAQSGGFFTLMEQFVGAGLVVGVAGIGVIMVRAVRERRREIGVLRSLGFQSSAVARTFLFEAGFVATVGVAIGVVIALIATYVLAVSGADFAEGFRFAVPVGDVLVIVAVALVPATLAAVLPARQASRIEPAVSLRAAD